MRLIIGRVTYGKLVVECLQAQGWVAEAIQGSEAVDGLTGLASGSRCGRREGHLGRAAEDEVCSRVRVDGVVAAEGV